MSIDLEALYIDLHQNPELSFQELRTSARLSKLLSDLGCEVIENIGGTGLAAIIRNGEGPVVWLRADMDALPVEEQSGLPYASTVQGTDEAGNTVPIMHACGHDMHMTAMIGAAERLIVDLQTWAGTVVILMQPAEELGQGARAMLDDGLLDRVPRPDIVLGQHLTPLPAGRINVHPGPQTSGCDTIEVIMHGRGGHGSRPHTTVDAVVMAAATVMRLQTVVARLVDPREVAVVTVGSMQAGRKDNIIADEATLALSIRYANDETRAKLLEHIERIVQAEAHASGATREPTIVIHETLPPTINDEEATHRLIDVFQKNFGEQNIVDLGMSPGSEDVSWFARDADVPMVFWYWGGWDQQAYADAEKSGRLDLDVPTNHSPLMAPVIHPTIETGVSALVIAAKEFLAK